MKASAFVELKLSNLLQGDVRSLPLGEASELSRVNTQEPYARGIGGSLDETWIYESCLLSIRVSLE